MTQPSLRERSKERRRAAIEQAALQLFAERGYDATTLAQVAEVAEVAPRTVSLYFPSKLHLALSYQTDAGQRLEAAIIGRTPGTSALSVITTWLRAEFDEHGELLDFQAAMLRSNPEIRGAETPELSEAKRAVTTALAADLGRDDDDVIVGLVGGAFEGIINVLTQIGRDRAAAASAFEVATKLLAAVIRAAQTNVERSR